MLADFVAEVADKRGKLRTLATIERPTEFCGPLGAIPFDSFFGVFCRSFKLSEASVTPVES